MVQLIPQIDPMVEIEATLEEAKKEAKERGATKVVVVLLKDKNDLYESISFKSDNMKRSETVALLEIAKRDVINRMEGLDG